MATSNAAQPMEAAEAHRESLLLEASLAASCLGGGLTAIRQYSFADKGRFFAGMFGVTIGLERILKLCIVLEHLLRTGSPPTEKQLKDLGHSLSALLRAVRKVNAECALGVDEAPITESLSERIVDLLTAFAKQARYFNLNVVTGAPTTPSSEPLAAWARDIGEELVRRHYRPSAKGRAELATAASLNGVPGVVVGHVGDDGTSIQEFGDFALQSAVAETKQKYSVFYIHRIALFGIGVLDRLDHQLNLYLREHFRWLDVTDRAAILRRKRWDRTE